MASTAEYKCRSCKQPFTARTADRKRGWAKFCSKSCKAIRQTQRTGRGRGGMRNIPMNVSVDQYRADARQFGGTPQYDRNGVYEGFTMSPAELAGGGYGDADFDTPFGEGKD